MCTSRITHILSVILLVAFTSSALAAEGDWKFPNLNPFAKKSSSKKRPARSTVSDGGSTWYTPRLPEIPKPSMPKFGGGSKRKSRSNQPSTITKMTEGTKDFFAKSYDVLTPWDNDSRSAKSNSRKRSSARTARKDSSWFDFSKNDEREIEAVNDFLDLPRPE